MTCNRYVSNRNASQNLSNTDIDGKFLTLILTGSQPKLFGSRYSTVTKPQTNLSNNDIERSAPRSRYLHLKKPDNQLRLDDIEFASPLLNRFTTTRNSGNPLNPTYNLPAFSYATPRNDKFLKDQLDLSDI